MSQFSPRGMIIVGILLMLMGIILPLLMVVKVVTAGFFLSFLSYGSSVAGLFLGIMGILSYTRSRRE
jgi:hypothetical protein